METSPQQLAFEIASQEEWDSIPQATQRLTPTEHKRTYDRQWREECKRNGLCQACAQPAAPGKTMREACLEKKRQRYRAKREQGLCGTCNRPLDAELRAAVAPIAAPTPRAGGKSKRRMAAVPRAGSRPCRA